MRPLNNQQDSPDMNYLRHTHENPAAAQRGVTLLEMLAVIAIIGLVSALATPALNALGKTAAVGTGGSRLAGLASVARQNAVSKQAMTALVLSNQGTTRGRLLTIVELATPANGAAPGSADWRQISQWELLPEGTILEHLSAAQIPPQPALPGLPYKEGIIQDFKFVVFCPDGSLLDSECQTFRLAEGFYTEGSDEPAFIKPNSGGAPQNFCNITVLPKTGRTKIDRP